MQTPSTIVKPITRGGLVMQQKVKVQYGITPIKERTMCRHVPTDDIVYIANIHSDGTIEGCCIVDSGRDYTGLIKAEDCVPFIGTLTYS